MIAGSVRFPGAAVLAAAAAARAGAGYVTLAVPASVVAIAQGHLLEVPVIAAPEVDGAFAPDALLHVLSQVRRPDAILAGPGLTVTAGCESVVGALINQALTEGLPLLLDADALNVLAAAFDACPHPAALAALTAQSQSAPPPPLPPLRQLAVPCQGQPYCQPESQQLGQYQPHQLVITPHAGELKRLLQATGSSNAAELAKRLQAVVVAKGPRTEVFSPEAAFPAYVYDGGTPALAKAGTGDVLAGIIASLLAQRMPSLKAASAGVELHGRAGLSAESKTSRRSLVARDMIDALASVFREIEGI